MRARSGAGVVEQGRGVDGDEVLGAGQVDHDVVVAVLAHTAHLRSAVTATTTERSWPRAARRSWRSRRTASQSVTVDDRRPVAHHELDLDVHAGPDLRRAQDGLGEPVALLDGVDAGLQRVQRRRRRGHREDLAQPPGDERDGDAQEHQRGEHDHGRVDVGGEVGAARGDEDGGEDETDQDADAEQRVAEPLGGLGAHQPRAARRGAGRRSPRSRWRC